MRLEGIWNIEYVQKLGILDHCNEIKVINDEIIKAKNGVGTPLLIKELNESFEKECMDLLLILSTHFGVCQHITYNMDKTTPHRNLLDDRLKKFKEKALND